MSHRQDGDFALTAQSETNLRREIGVVAAMMMGMGSIVGTGVFVSIGIAAETAGPSVMLAIALASLVAVCNGLSSAQLAANHPVSGGTYEYGYRWLSPRLGFTAGWMFLCAKCASAATAALGLAGYALHLTGQSRSGRIVPLALLGLLVLSAITFTGIRRSNTANMTVVTVTLLVLGLFIIVGLPTAISRASANLTPFFGGSGSGFLQATALMFVAYTGYGRIATLGEEVQQPRRTIPRAVIATLIASMLLYIGVAFVGLATIGAQSYGEASRQQVAPLEIIAAQFAVPGLATIVAVGAVTAMLGVLLNLLLGLSRVLLAMGRRGDMPLAVAAVSQTTGIPWVATIIVTLFIAGLVLVGDVRLTWSFSAFTVLIYYALTNLCAIRLKREQRLFPIWPAYGGLAACVFLAFWVDVWIWAIGLGLIAVGLLWHEVARRWSGQDVKKRSTTPAEFNPRVGDGPESPSRRT